jgi:uncharacterized protein
MVPDRRVRVTLVYALPDAQEALELELPEGVTAGRALSLSGMLERYPEIDEDTVTLGIYGRTVAADTMLKDGDRIEIYRPLVADPKLARRRRAARTR